MTTFNTIEEMVRILDANPELAETLRARLLTRELIELPETLASFIAATTKQFEEIASRFEQIDRRFEQIDRRFEQIDRRFDLIDRRFDLIDQRFDLVDRRFHQMEIDMGYLKGSHARTAAIREAELIASEMGMRWVRNVSPGDLLKMVHGADTTGLSAGDTRSFIRADLIIEATRENDESCFIAVEVSFTADGRDTERAMRNARWLTNFTGKPSQPALAAMRLDRRIEDAVNAGQVFWYELEPEDMEAE